jgi:hypothetical protein
MGPKFHGDRLSTKEGGVRQLDLLRQSRCQSNSQSNRSGFRIPGARSAHLSGSWRFWLEGSQSPVRNAIIGRFLGQPQRLHFLPLTFFDI